MKHVYMREGKRGQTFFVQFTHDNHQYYAGSHKTEEAAIEARNEALQSLGIPELSNDIAKRLYALPIGKRTLFKAPASQALTMRRSIVHNLKTLNLKALVVSSRQGVYVTRTE